MARGVSVSTASGNSSSGITLNNNNIYDNAGIGLNVSAGSYTGILNAENNYWGTANGPTIATNPGGTGDEIADPDGVVDYNPFLTALSVCAPVVIRPSLTITPSGGTVGGATTTFTFTFSEPVTGFTDSDITVANGTKSGFTMVNSSTYTVNVTPTSNGPITVSVPQNAAVNAQNSGNTAATSTVNVRCNNVSIPTGRTVAGNTQFVVPVNVDDTTGQGIISYDFTLTYNQAAVTFVGAENAGTLSSNFSITTNNGAGTLTVSGFGTVPLTGSGVLLNLRFISNGGIGTTSNLNFTSFRFNEGVPCVNTSNGNVTVVSGTISGQVLYVNADTPPKPVPNTLITATGSFNTSTTTDTNGQYTLSNLGSGPYTVTPSKTGQTNGISNLDASRVAQHVAGLVTLNSTQLIAADVSANGQVTSFDAALIAQYVAGIPNSGITGRWKFIPVNRSYPNVETNYTNQDYSAILLGEVTGNWNPNDPNGAILSQASEQSSAQIDRPEQPVVAVSAPAAQFTSRNSNFTVSIAASDTTAAPNSPEGIIGYQFDLVYDANVIVPQAAPCDKTGTISTNLNVTCNPATPGLLKVVVFGTTQTSGAGTLLKLNFNAVGASGASSPLTFQNFMFNEGVPRSVTTNGTITIAGPTAAGVSLSGRIMTGTMRGVGSARVVLTNSDGESRTVSTNRFGYYSFRDLTAGQTYVLTVKSKRFEFASQVVTANEDVTGYNMFAGQ